MEILERRNLMTAYIGGNGDATITLESAGTGLIAVTVIDELSNSPRQWTISSAQRIEVDGLGQGYHAQGHHQILIDANIRSVIDVYGTTDETGPSQTTLIVFGHDSGSARYKPDAATAETEDHNSGQITTSGLTVSYHNFKQEYPISLTHFDEVELDTPAGNWKVGVDPAAGGIVVQTYQAGVQLPNLRTLHVDRFVVDNRRRETPGGDTNVVTLGAIRIGAEETTKELSIRTGAGDDKLYIPKRDGVPGPSLEHNRTSFENGLGNDTIDIEGYDNYLFAEDHLAFGGNDLWWNVTPENLDIVGTAEEDTFTFAGWTQNAVLDGGVGYDKLFVQGFENAELLAGTNVIDRLKLATSLHNRWIDIARIERTELNDGLTTRNNNVKIDNIPTNPLWRGVQEVVVDTGPGLDTISVNDTKASLRLYGNEGDDVLNIFSASGSRLLADGGPGSDEINISGVARVPDAVLRGGDGEDLFKVGSFSRNLNDVTGLIVEGGSGADRLALFDESNPYTLNGGHDFKVTASRISRNDTIPANHDQAPFTRNVGVDFSSISKLDVHCGGVTNEKGNRISVESVPGTTRIFAGIGSDQVYLAPTSKNLDLVNGVSVIGQAGSNGVELFDQNNPYAFDARLYEMTGGYVSRFYQSPALPQSPQRLFASYADMEGVTLHTGNRGDAVNVVSYMGNVKLDTGEGDDVAIVNLAGFRTEYVGMLLPLHVDGGNGVNTLTVVDNGTQSHQYDLRAGALDRDAAPAVAYQAMGFLNFASGSQNDVLRVQQITAGIVANLSGGGGADTLVATNLANSFTVTGENAGRLADDASGRSVEFKQFEKLQASGANNRFIFASGGSLAGHIEGLSDNDTLDYSGWSAGVEVLLNVRLGVGTATAIAGQVVGIENVIGTPYDDVISGNNFANRLEGRGGSDILVGISAYDTLLGGNGNDLLIGGNGRDGLSGGWGSDVLVGGRTAIDNDVTALRAARTEWLDSSSSYAERLLAIDALFGSLVDDAAADALRGQQDRDAFWIGALDTVFDPEDDERRRTVS